MPRASVTKNYYNFSGGLFTDGSLLAPPENTSSVLQNVDIEADGSVKRRMGFLLEDHNKVWSNYSNNAKINTYVWEAAGEHQSLEYHVLRIGRTVQIYDPNIIPMASGIIGSISIQTYATGSDWITEDLQFSSGKGKLYITGSDIEPLQVSVANSIFSVEIIKPKIRDFEGIDDGFEVAYRPPTDLMTLHHMYNIHNQGWGSLKYNLLSYNFAYDWHSFALTYRKYPSNADIVLNGMSTKNGLYGFEEHKVVNGDFGTSNAPKGSYILDYFNRERTLIKDGASAESQALYNILYVEGQRLSDWSETEYITERPTANAFYAGRLWLGSVKGELLFSQILTEEDSVHKYYQEQDPTAEDLNELLDTDGGVIPIPGVGKVVKMVEVGNSLVVLSNNGIWRVSGQDSPFTANNISVNKVSDIGVSNSNSIVITNSGLFFWGDYGIYVMSQDKASGGLVVQSITDNRLEVFIKEIHEVSKENCIGGFDTDSNKIYWMYSSTSEDTYTTDVGFKDRFLIFDVTLNAFYTYASSSLLASGAIPIAMFPGKGVEKVTISSDITVDNDLVTASGVSVYIPSEEFNAAVSRPRFATLIDNTKYVAFSTLADDYYEDWWTYQASLYTSKVEVNPETLGEASLSKQATYVTTYYKYVEPVGEPGIPE